MRRVCYGLLAMSLAASCGAPVEVRPQSTAATATLPKSVTDFVLRTQAITYLCVGVPNTKRVPGDMGLGMIVSNMDFVGTGAITEMLTPTAFTLVIPGQTTWAEIVEETVFTGGIKRVEDLRLAVGSHLRVTICHKAWDGARVIGGYQGFYRLAAIGPA